MVFLDISRTFDRIWHEGLIYKLKCIGIENSLLSLLGDYLCNRKQSMVLAGNKSSVMSTNAGVYQSSILGPLLCLLFINAIENNISSDLSLFADDATLAKSCIDSTEAMSVLNCDLDLIST